MPFKLLFILLFSITLHAKINLNKEYYIDSNDINISSVIRGVSNDVNLYKIEQNKDKKRVKSKELIQLLKKHGYRNYFAKSSYILFIKKSPIDTYHIRQEVKKYYENKYQDIQIKEIFINPRSYMSALPKHYEINFKSRNFLSNRGILNIKTPKRKKIFFNYEIIAKVPVYIARNQINRKTHLTALNTIKKYVLLDRFNSLPISDPQKQNIQTKRKIKREKVILERDIQSLSLVRKNSRVVVILKNEGVFINFNAKATQDGKLNDIITIQKSDGKKLKATVIGKNKVELR